MRENRVRQLYTSEGKVFAEYKYNHECFKHFSKHSHQTLNIIAIGSGTIEIDYHAQPTRELHTRQLAIFNPLHVHKTQKQSEETLPYYSLHLDKDWCQAIQTQLFGQCEMLLPLVPNILDDTQLHQHFMTLFQLLLSNENTHVEPLLEAFAKDLFGQYCSKEISSSRESSLLLSIESYIMEHLDTPLSLEDIATAVGYSSAHINRLFKQQHGLTLHAFLVDKKLHKAKALMLLDRSCTLTDIAYEAGFYDQSHFIKAFKRVYSLSPNAYKK